MKQTTQPSSSAGTGALLSPQVDKGQALRRSHDNPSIQRIYSDFLGQPGGEVGLAARRCRCLRPTAHCCRPPCRGTQPVLADRCCSLSCCVQTNCCDLPIPAPAEPLHCCTPPHPAAVAQATAHALY